ncbi:AP-3 complex subunit delta-1-like [Lycorma delicatula]|uniref:AP-3 complex subunit delta-1-like n=1 Tax=Lycorma delicatula TaxID=130591 RepID=UPI003F510C3B
MAQLLEDAHILTQPGSKMADVLYAAAWICGEFALYVHMFVIGFLGLCSADLEVQERASSALHLVQFFHEQLKGGEPLEIIACEMAALFSGELNPVAPKAQRKVQVPEG